MWFDFQKTFASLPNFLSSGYVCVIAGVVIVFGIFKKLLKLIIIGVAVAAIILLARNGVFGPIIEIYNQLPI